MVTLGWMSDAHVNTDGGSAPGPGATLTADMDDLFNNKGVSHIYWNGDQVAADDPNREPHSIPAYYDEFWSLVDNSAQPSNVTAIPGNHEAPIQTHVQSDDRAVLRFRDDYDADNVTVIGMNTAAPGFVTGGGGQGVGWTRGHVPRRDIKWLDDQLADAGTNAKVVFFHHQPQFLNNQVQYTDNRDYIGNAESYWICQNYKAITDVLESYNKVVVPTGHIFQFQNDGSETVNGVDYLYKKHYYDTTSDTIYNYAYIDVTSTSATATVVAQDGTETQIYTQTF
jgi:hypothetical protein